MLHSFKNIERDIYIKPPKEIKKDGIIWKLNKVAYGLCDASRQWYFGVKEELCKLGCKQSQMDKAMFRWYNQGHLEGLFIMHVDDFLYSRTENFKKTIINQIQEKFKVGKHMEGNFKYVGFDIIQTEEGIISEQNNYINSVQPIPTSPKHKSEKYAELNQEEISELRAVIGQLSWVATSTRPDISFDVLELSMAIKHPLVEHIIKANKLIQMLKSYPCRILFPVLGDVQSIQIYVYFDASWGNLSDGSSAEGYIILLSTQNEKYSPMSRSSNKIHRKVQSTLCAETLATYDAVDEAIYIGHMLTELYYDDYHKNQFPVTVYTDNQSLYDNLHSTKQVKEKRLRITMTGIQVLLENGNIKKVKWISNNHQLADPLTKRGTSSEHLLNCLYYGQTS